MEVVVVLSERVDKKGQVIIISSTAVYIINNQMKNIQQEYPLQYSLGPGHSIYDALFLVKYSRRRNWQSKRLIRQSAYFFTFNFAS